ncbi:anaerobic ribonucleoside-triphosphate reductase activating protein [Dermabacteraceae bacterium P13136]
MSPQAVAPPAPAQTPGAGIPRPPATANELRIAGMVPYSSVDWPGKLALSVFCQGCPWKCLYCHNHDIIDPRKPGSVPWEKVRSLLSRRAGLLDAIVFSGGEACLQRALVPAAREAKEMGFLVGLHTCGAYPKRLAELLSARLVDWVGFDLKASPAGYPELVGRPNAWRPVEASLAKLVASRVAYEVRMTVTPGLVAQVPQVLAVAARAGVTEVVLRQARADGAPTALREALRDSPGWDGVFSRAVASARNDFPALVIRERTAQ